MTEKTTPDENADENNPIARRNFLLGAGTAVAAGLAPNGAAQAQQPTATASPAPTPEPDQFVTLTAPEAAFVVAAVAQLREHDRPFVCPRTGKDRHLETAVIVSPLDVPVAGRLPILEEVCWFSAGYAHIELTPPAMMLRQVTPVI